MSSAGQNVQKKIPQPHLFSQELVQLKLCIDLQIIIRVRAYPAYIRLANMQPLKYMTCAYESTYATNTHPADIPLCTHKSCVGPWMKEE